MSGPRVAFVHNFCSHYTTRTFELVAAACDVDFYFFSGGDDWYWLRKHGVCSGRFRHTYLKGIRVGGTRITPGLPFALARGRYDCIIKCINGRFALPITYLTARILRRPFILYTGIWHRLGTLFHRLAFPITRFIYRHADAIVVYGEHVKRYLVSEGVDPARIHIAPHAVDNAQYRRRVSEEEISALRLKLDIGPNSKIVLYVGRLEKVKGLSYLLDAFRRADRQDAVLVIAGEGSERCRLRDQATALGVEDRIRFVGYVPPNETVILYAAASVFVLPSITTPRAKELWGLVINEALNQGLPVITTNAVGAAACGLVEERVNGFIVPEKDSGALTAALDALLGDPALREAMSRKAREKISGWSQERMATGFLEAIDCVTAQKTERTTLGVRSR